VPAKPQDDAVSLRRSIERIENDRGPQGAVSADP
jgi:hypothetical protein